MKKWKDYHYRKKGDGSFIILGYAFVDGDRHGVCL